MPLLQMGLCRTLLQGQLPATIRLHANSTPRSHWARAATATPSSVFDVHRADERTEALLLYKANLPFLETKEGGLSLKPPISTHF